MYKSTKAFLEAFRQVVDNQLLAYEEEVIKAFEREVREHRENWERFEELPDETVEEILKGMLEFVMKEVYPKTALARLEREIVGVKEEIRNSEERIKEKVDKNAEKLSGMMVDIAEIAASSAKGTAKITRELEEIKEDVKKIKEDTEITRERVRGIKKKLGVKTLEDYDDPFARLERRAEIAKAVLNERDPYDDDPLYKF